MAEREATVDLRKKDGMMKNIRIKLLNSLNFQAANQRSKRILNISGVASHGRLRGIW